VWIGWLGEEVPPEDQDEVRQRLLAEHSCLPVFISDALVDKYYNGFSNGVLWPLFHYVPLPMYKVRAHATWAATGPCPAQPNALPGLSC
jgi:trehalose-6-phosphate synthase